MNYYLFSILIFILGTNVIKCNNSRFESDVIMIPIRVQDGSREYISNFRYHRVDESNTLHEECEIFCRKHNIMHNQCVLLEEYASIKLKNSLDKPPIEFKIPNEHLRRHESAILAEFEANLDISDQRFQKINFILEKYNKIFDNVPFPSDLKRVAFIHSCILSEYQQISVLEEIINNLKVSQLLYKLDKVWIFNYGYPIPVYFQEDFSNYSHISIVQITNDTSMFEIPTLLLMREFSRKVTNTMNPPMDKHNNIHILYLHTKGISYSEEYKQIYDWRQMMMYFLVERHEVSYHLLESTLFDIIGNTILFQ